MRLHHANKNPRLLSVYAKFTAYRVLLNNPLKAQVMFLVFFVAY